MIKENLSKTRGIEVIKPIDKKIKPLNRKLFFAVDRKTFLSLKTGLNFTIISIRSINNK